MEFSVKAEIEKAMDLFNAQGVTEIIRVIPDANMDIGFNLMSASHYSKRIKVHTLRSRQEAEAHLGSEKPIRQRQEEARECGSRATAVLRPLVVSTRGRALFSSRRPVGAGGCLSDAGELSSSSRSPSRIHEATRCQSSRSSAGAPERGSISSMIFLRASKVGRSMLLYTCGRRGAR